MGEEGRHTDFRLHCPRCCRALGLQRSEKRTWSRYTAGCCEAGKNTLADELCVGASLKRGRFEGTYLLGWSFLSWRQDRTHLSAVAAVLASGCLGIVLWRPRNRTERYGKGFLVVLLKGSALPSRELVLCSICQGKPLGD